MPADLVIVIAIVTLAAVGRGWRLAAARRRSGRVLRTRRRRRAEMELFERLERCMQSDRVD
jgi:hypothetical protein